jgi:hypothetical protein
VESAVDPDKWGPVGDAINHSRPTVGDVIGWRCAAWRVTEVRPIPDTDLRDKDRAQLAIWNAEYRERNRPYHLVMVHERGLQLVADGDCRRLHDGTIQVHLTVRRPDRAVLPVLGDRYAVCVCHDHPWPCQDYDRDRMAEAAAKRMEKDLLTADPGVCAACLEPITTRQRTLTFPEGSLIVPGAPGPTFHAGRRSCWSAATRYEIEKRLVAYPDVIRVASCPGVLFSHLADSREECTVEGLCTGAHGPAGARGSLSCVERRQMISNEGGDPRPPTDCGYDGGFGRCLGADLSSGAPDPFTAADQLRDIESRRNPMRRSDA